MRFYILDERDVWHEALAAAAKKRGFDPQRIRRGEQVTERGWFFLRPHATPDVLRRNQCDYAVALHRRCKTVQDTDQVMLYEDKVGQFQKWARWMPPTWLFEDRDDAMLFAQYWTGGRVVSKAKEGASSMNVRVLSPTQLMGHFNEVFGKGVPVKHCDSKGTTSLQQGYALLQEFVPHDVTYRVNVIGRGRAVFKRYNYPDRPVAQTGNVEAMTEPDEELLAFADEVAAAIGTKWCALDILKWPNGNGYYLLETSLAWPWPSKEPLASAPIFRTNYTWGQLFDCLLEEICDGVFDSL